MTAVLAHSHSKEEQQKLWGSVALLIYMAVWVCSLISPLIVIGLIYLQCFKAAIFTTLLMFSAHVPNLWPRVKAFREFMGSAFKYFQEGSLRYEEEVDTTGTRPTIVCVHPHGIFPLGWGMLTTRPEMADVHFCFSSVLYASPFFLIFCKLIGKPNPADKKTMQRLMKERKTMALIPGGFEEATITTNNADRVFIKARMGFVCYALRHGYCLTPTFAFGENRCFMNVQGAWRFRLWLNSLGFPAILPWSFPPPLPYDKSLNVVVGKPLQLPTIRKPTDSQVEEWHGKYMVELEALYNRHKGTFGVKGDLEVW
mmetsp:Transcript_11893/g.32147  ORF Transcript_11893/g.32147 Transcript_11893/m.32147 type:complete len:312 (+) Transcript_11893:183-1118(+)|eukprot:CAMPEP_0119468922 /NCGR_PEP_ID=MMETSP1344-20130328/2469_1 /TAXON_ID=236787 /ORGANISM="Florenciella parvula, Strain CCMP2471" /LENGTH=311 /DNA_ID=CAMNT_0007501437 /DNA_START=453 /DNA_END=1385 /DNA_ORIENTATION=-